MPEFVVTLKRNDTLMMSVEVTVVANIQDEAEEWALQWVADGDHECEWYEVDSAEGDVAVDTSKPAHGPKAVSAPDGLETVDTPIDNADSPHDAVSKARDTMISPGGLAIGFDVSDKITTTVPMAGLPQAAQNAETIPEAAARQDLLILHLRKAVENGYMIATPGSSEAVRSAFSNLFATESEVDAVEALIDRVTEDVSMDRCPMVSHGDGGYWVQAWVWVQTYPSNESENRTQISEIPEAYRSRTPEHALAHRVEEMGEAITALGSAVAAIGKTRHRGWSSVNPELPVHEQETNIDWVMRELGDAERAIVAFRSLLTAAKPDADAR